MKINTAKIKKTIFRWAKDPYVLGLGVLVIAGSVLRFYNLKSYVTFLGDQARDAIVLRRIVTFQDLPFIGPQASVGELFLGPFYYYFIAPWLLLFDFNPIGPAVGVAVFSILMLIVAYVMLQDLFNKRVALIATGFMTFSLTLVNLSRYSWNPNLLPLFSLLTMYFFIKALDEKRMLWFFLTGSFLSMATQLHYIALSFGVPMMIFLGVYLWQNRTKLIDSGKHVAALASGFILFHVPLILFDVKNNFLNARGFIKLLTERGEAGQKAPLDEIMYTFQEFNMFVFQFGTERLLLTVILVLIAVFAAVTYKKQRNISIIAIFFLLMLVQTSFLTQNKYVHYFAALYPLYYIIIAYLLSKAFQGKQIWIIGIILAVFIYAQAPHYNYLYESGSNQLKINRNIAQEIIPHITSEKYQLVGIPDTYGDYTIRYFLEAYGYTPLERGTFEKGDEMFIVCSEECTPIGDPQWDIAYFAPTDIVGTWEVEDVTIYKVIRDENNINDGTEE